ncbi:hypothetical protein PoB_002539200 [Plakobranchus ocellatus]|uniref:Uncharacterized protein n=1 Tax=Plakobranchus ocellatus TaxID=259542 RepID=A0AAV3ZWD3_9GAST|nr:hypothetical protein PoB_002539200 [Plakobranchus ocellatus]
MDNWENVDEVLLDVFNKDQLVKNIVFNGRSSTPTTWFEANRVSDVGDTTASDSALRSQGSFDRVFESANDLSTSWPGRDLEV